MPEAALLEAPLEDAELDELDSPAPPGAEMLLDKVLLDRTWVEVLISEESVVGPAVEVLWPVAVIVGILLLEIDETSCT